MNRLSRLLFCTCTLAGIAASAGCGGSGGILWGCDKRTISNGCIDYVGSAFASLQSSCTNDSGTVVTSCTTTGMVGTCTLAAGTSAEQRQHYYTAGTASTAQAPCTATGSTWSNP